MECSTIMSIHVDESRSCSCHGGGHRGLPEVALPRSQVEGFPGFANDCKELNCISFGIKYACCQPVFYWANNSGPFSGGEVKRDENRYKVISIVYRIPDWALP